MRRVRVVGMVAGGLLLLCGSLAQAQQGRTGGGSTGGGFGGSTGGSTGGGFGGSTGGGFVGGSSGSGGFAGGGFSGGGSGTGFTGGNSFGSGGTGTGGMGGSGGRGTSSGSTSVFGKYMGNPLAAGMATSSGTSSGQGSSYARQFPVTLSFGTALYNNTANVSSSRNSGTSALGGLGGTTGGTTANSNLRYSGASSVGIRRAPGYLTEPGFTMPARPVVATVRGDLQDVIGRSERLAASRGNIRVLNEGDTIVLRGQVANERERRHAEAILRLSPGVREIRNELEVPER